MNFNQLAVKHRAFGEGIVTDYDGKYMHISFPSGTKTFVYPDAFAKYLTLADGSISDEIRADLQKSEQAKQAILDRKNAENMLAMTHGIVIPGKEMQPGGEEYEPRFKPENEEP